MRRWVPGLLLFVATAFIFLLTASRSTTSVDVYDTGLGSWRIAETGAPWLEGFDLESLGRDTELVRLFIHEAPNGHTVVHRAPGAIAAGVPAYWLAQSQTFVLWPQAVTAALLTALSVLLLYLAMCTRLSRSTSLVAALIVGLTTPVWSVAADGLWPHTLTVLGISGMAWAAATERWWLVGCFGGVALWGRVHVSLIVAVVGLGVALSRRRPWIALAVGVPSLLMMALATVWTHWLYGRWSPTGGYDEGDVMTRVGTGNSSGLVEQIVNQIGMWLAPDRGLLVWTPLIVVIAPSVLRAWHDTPDWSRWLLLGGTVYTLAQAWFSPFHGGDAFYGYRLGIEFLVCATPVAAYSWTRAGTWARRAIGPVTGFQLATISVGAISNGLWRSETEVWNGHVFFAACLKVPVLWAWLAVFVLIGGLLARAIADRRARSDEATADV